MTNLKNIARLPLIALATLPLIVGAAGAQTTNNAQPQRVQPAQPCGNTADKNAKPCAPKNGAAQGQNQNQNGGRNGGKDQNGQGGPRGGDQRGGDMRGGDQRGGDQRGGDMRGGPEGGPRGDQRGNGQRGGPNGGPRGDMRGGMRGGGQVIGAAVAKALGLTEQELMTQLQSGKTITDIAKAKGVSTASIQSAALSALKTQLAADVKAGKLTQAQADDMLKRVQADTNFALDFGRGGHRHGGPDGGKDGNGKDGNGKGGQGTKTAPTGSNT